MTTSLSHNKHSLGVNDNYLFLIIHLCAIAFIARVLFSILYPPITDGDGTIVDKATAMSVDLLKIKTFFFWYASVPFLYIVWKRAWGAAVGIIVSVLTGIPGFFAGEWIGRVQKGSQEMIFLGLAALFIYPLFIFFKHKWAAIHRHIESR